MDLFTEYYKAPDGAMRSLIVYEGEDSPYFGVTVFKYDEQNKRWLYDYSPAVVWDTSLQAHEDGKRYIKETYGEDVLAVKYEYLNIGSLGTLCFIPEKELDHFKETFRWFLSQAVPDVVILK